MLRATSESVLKEACGFRDGIQGSSIQSMSSALLSLLQFKAGVYSASLTGEPSAVYPLLLCQELLPPALLQGTLLCTLF